MFSIVLPLLAVRMSEGTTALPLIMFSQAATIKCASTPSGAVIPVARAAPSTAAAPVVVAVLWVVVMKLGERRD